MRGHMPPRQHPAQLCVHETSPETASRTHTRTRTGTDGPALSRGGRVVRAQHRCIMYSALQRSPVQRGTLIARTATEARPDHSSPSPRGKTAAARRSCGRGVLERLWAYPRCSSRRCLRRSPTSSPRSRRRSWRRSSAERISCRVATVPPFRLLSLPSGSRAGGTLGRARSRRSRRRTGASADRAAVAPVPVQMWR